MSMVKRTIRKQRLSGDLRFCQAATAEAVARFDEELDTLVRMSEKEREERAGDLLCAKGRLLRFMGKNDDALDAFVEGLSLGTIQRSRPVRSRLRAEVGLTHLQMSDCTRARKEFKGAYVAIQRMEEQDHLLPAVLNGLGLCAWKEGLLGKARTYYEKALDASREVACEVLEVDARNNLAILDWRKGDIRQALKGLRACLGLWKKIGSRHEEAATLNNIGIMEEQLGSYGHARRHYQRSLTLCQELGDRQAQISAYCNLGSLTIVRKEWKQAEEYCRQALELARELGDAGNEAIAQENLALVRVGLGEIQDAWKHLEGARKAARRIPDRERLFSLELVEIEVLLAQEKWEGLASRLEKAERKLHKSHYTGELPRLLRLRAHAEILSGQESKARKTLRRAHRVAQSQQTRVELQRVVEIGKRIGWIPGRSRET